MNRVDRAQSPPDFRLSRLSNVLEQESEPVRARRARRSNVVRGDIEQDFRHLEVVAGQVAEDLVRLLLLEDRFQVFFRQACIASVSQLARSVGSEAASREFSQPGQTTRHFRFFLRWSANHNGTLVFCGGLKGPYVMCSCERPRGENASGNARVRRTKHDREGEKVYAVEADYGPEPDERNDLDVTGSRGLFSCALLALVAVEEGEFDESVARRDRVERGEFDVSGQGSPPPRVVYGHVCRALRSGAVFCDALNEIRERTSRVAAREAWVSTSAGVGWA